MVFGKAATLTALSWRVSVTAVEQDVCQELMTNVRRMKGEEEVPPFDPATSSGS